MTWAWLRPLHSLPTSIVAMVCLPHELQKLSKCSGGGAPLELCECAPCSATWFLLVQQRSVRSGWQSFASFFTEGADFIEALADT